MIVDDFVTASSRTQSARSMLARLGAFQKAHAVRLKYFARRLMRGQQRALQEAAVDCQVLSPAITIPYVAPRMPEGHFERIKSGCKGDTPAAIIARLRQSESTHDATIMYTLRDVALIGARLFANGTSVDLDRGRMPKPLEVETFDEVGLASTWAASHWFGHLIHDEFPLQMLASELGTAVAQARPVFRDEPGYRQAFNIPPPVIAPGFTARYCHVFSDHAQNESKRARYARMRATVPRSSGPSTRVYIQRAGGNSRILREEPQLIDELAKRGFVILNNGSDSVERMVEVCSRASQVVSVDGSHAAPAMILAPGGAEFFGISPPNRVTENMMDIAHAAGLRTAFYIGERGEEDAFSVNVDHLVRFIEDL